ncbi:hypothetical protein SNEBB_001402 [Seison nebaliae]|nr:hypothetical protein SNEBB_001402 [Seison nebaliae]
MFLHLTIFTLFLLQLNSVPIDDLLTNIDHHLRTLDNYPTAIHYLHNAIDRSSLVRRKKIFPFFRPNIFGPLVPFWQKPIFRFPYADWNGEKTNSDLFKFPHQFSLSTKNLMGKRSGEFLKNLEESSVESILTCIEELLESFKLSDGIDSLKSIFKNCLRESSKNFEESLTNYNSVVLDNKNEMKLYWNTNRVKTVNENGDDVSDVKSFDFIIRTNLNHSPNGIVFGFTQSQKSLIDSDLILINPQHTNEHRLIEHLLFVNGSINGRSSTMNTLKKIKQFKWKSFNYVQFEREREPPIPFYEILVGTTHLVMINIEKGLSSTSSVVVGNDLPMLNKLHFGEPIYQMIQLPKSKLFYSTLHSTPNNFTIKFRARNVEIPSDETTYWCTTFKFPKLSHKHHIIAFDAELSPESSGIVHHMELFHCWTDDEVVEYNGRCTSEGKPSGLESCRKVLGAWAMGANEFIYPANTGTPVGGEAFPPYVVLEIHYNNPRHILGVRDSSGIRFTITPDIRSNDAAIMELGLEYNELNSIPPQSPKFIQTAFCLSECTEQIIPEKGISVFASQLHTHLTGIGVSTYVVRKDGKIISLNRDENYDSTFQEIRLLQNEVKIFPGDMIIHQCLHNTMERNKMTFGGTSIFDEMCLNYIHYYPSINLELCKSAVDEKSLDKLFSTYNYSFNISTNGSNDHKKLFNMMNINPFSRQLLQNFYNRAPITQSCNSSDGRQLLESPFHLAHPIIEGIFED